MPDPLARTIETIEPHARRGVVVDAEASLESVLHDVERICSLPFWLEEMTGSIPTDAELLNWLTVRDVARWVASVEQRAV